MAYQDKSLTCSDCGAPFTFSANEQEFYASKGYTNEPKRCPACRQARKAQQGGNVGSGTRSYSSGQRQMYPAKCAACGKDTEVPFEPRGDRPVYCSDCYRTMKPAKNY